MEFIVKITKQKNYLNFRYYNKVVVDRIAVSDFISDNENLKLRYNGVYYLFDREITRFSTNRTKLYHLEKNVTKNLLEIDKQIIGNRVITLWLSTYVEQPVKHVLKKKIK